MAAEVGPTRPGFTWDATMDDAELDKLDAKYAARMRKLARNDPATDQADADRLIALLLRRLGLRQTARAYAEIPKYYAE